MEVCGIAAEQTDTKRGSEGNKPTRRALREWFHPLLLLLPRAACSVSA